MKAKAKVAALLLTGILAAGGTAIAANSADKAQAHHGMKQNGMMDMMGMGGMMESCERMMGDAPRSSAAMPQLPPGNEKLQIDMQAEMMQKMGEILSKYASRIADRPASAR